MHARRNMDNHSDVVVSTAAQTRIVVRQPGYGNQDTGDSLTEDFLTSMPERYRQEFGKVSARQHARIVAARGKLPIHVDAFSGSSAAGPGVCVVAAAAPMLLAVISTGLMLQGFDITRADAYTRRAASGAYEAVDFFWVRRSSAVKCTSLSYAEVSALRGSLSDLLSSASSHNPPHLATFGTSPGAGETQVKFRSIRGQPWVTLELEGNDRPGLLAVVATALSTEGVQIVDSRIRTYGRRVHDYFDILESDGSRPAGTRLQHIRLAILEAVDGPSHGA